LASSIAGLGGLERIERVGRTHSRRNVEKIGQSLQLVLAAVGDDCFGEGAEIPLTEDKVFSSAVCTLIRSSPAAFLFWTAESTVSNPTSRHRESRHGYLEETSRCRRPLRGRAVHFDCVFSEKRSRGRPRTINNSRVVWSGPLRAARAAVMRRNNLLPRRRVSLRYRHPASRGERRRIPESSGEFAQFLRPRPGSH